MYRILIFALLLSLANPALATGQEMAGLEVVIIGIASLIIGAVCGAVIVAILLLVTGFSGTLKKRPGRVAMISVAILLLSPVVVYLGFVIDKEVRLAREYPARHAWLTGWDADDPSTHPGSQPADLMTLARNRLRRLAQDIAIAWHRDPVMEEEERRASQGGAGAPADEK